MTEDRRTAVVAICASILAARKLASVPRNSPAHIGAIAEAIADARRIVATVERDNARREAPSLTRN